MQRTSLSLLTSALLAGLAYGQCNPLPPVTTLTTSGNGQNGTMFDIVNISAASVSITSFDQCFFSGTSNNMFIYTKAGTWNGSEANPAAWTLVGQATAVPHGVAPTLDAIPIPVNVTIGAGNTQGFYITGDAATTVAYTNGVTGVGQVIGTDGIIEVRGGIGKQYPFLASFGLPTQGRLWNGRVNHCAGGNAATNTTLGVGCVRASNSFYQPFATATLASPALSGNALVLTANATGYQGAWVPGGAAALYVTPVAAIQVATGDDGVVAYVPTAPLSTPYGPQATLQISGNAIIGFGAGVLDYPGTNPWTPTPNGFLNATLGGVYAWHDYNQGEVGSGQIVAEEIGGTLYVTFNDVENYATPETTNRSTLQFQLVLATGNIRIVWVTVDGNSTSGFGSGHLVGITAPGASNDPGAITLATASPAQLATSSPEVSPLSLTATTRPVTGTNWSLTTGNIPATGALGVTILGLSDPGINDLFFLGMPGCGLRASLDALNAFLVAGTTHNWSLALPVNPTLVGLHIYASSAVAQVPPVNAFGFITSNGVDGLIGDL